MHIIFVSHMMADAFSFKLSNGVLSIVYYQSNIVGRYSNCVCTLKIKKIIFISKSLACLLIVPVDNLGNKWMSGNTFCPVILNSYNIT